MVILGTICARGGSKGIPGKNLRPLAGKPLIVHTIELAQKVPSLSRVIVSTDSGQIAQVAREAGAEVPFLRPHEMATDDAPKWPALRHALIEMERRTGQCYELVVDLDPTSPLRTVGDVEGCIRTLRESGADVVFSVCEARKNPYFNMVEVDGRGFARLSKPLAAGVHRRQDAPKVYEMNASIYVYRREVVLAEGGLFSGRAAVWGMPPERSVDIDREVDFRLVEFLIGQEA